MKSQERRAHLIESATALFAEKGYSGTTTKEIARAAGVTEALIFRHFESKESLYKVVIEEYVDRSRRPGWHAEIRRCMDASNDVELFRKLIGYVIEAYRSDPLMQRLIIFATLEGHHKEADRACHLPKPLLKEVVAYLSRRQHEGVLVAMDPLGMFQTIFGMARSFAVGRYVYRLKEISMSDDQAIEMFLAFIVRAVFLAA
jgi:TetR/AcrR family transcriptional regulator